MAFNDSADDTLVGKEDPSDHHAGHPGVVMLVGSVRGGQGLMGLLCAHTPPGPTRRYLDRCW